MKILRVEVENFASYKNLEFNFDDKGLTLISGPTGSGKSTFCDLIPWVLFGRTAKNGAVDEIRSWNSDQPTYGAVHVETNNRRVLTVVRTRAPNDLYYFEVVDGHVLADLIRGKDLADTQKLINSLLGIDVNLYLSGAYFHEFCQSAQFFVTNAKNRRTIMEQLVDLSMPKRLQELTAAKKSNLGEVISEAQDQCSKREMKAQLLKAQLDKELENSEDWEQKRVLTINSYKEKFKNFESNRIETLRKLQAQHDQWEADNSHTHTDGTCPTCGGKTTKKITPKTNPYIQQIDSELNRKNDYMEVIRDWNESENPFNTDRTQKLLKTATDDFKDLEGSLKDWEADLLDTEHLYEILQEFRGVIIQRAVSTLQNNTNELLSKHFDAEIKVTFSATDADKLDVLIFKDGNECTYTQLSKGQRQLLKLCFGTSVMQAVANQHMTHFSRLFFDEALSGLDESMKVKAFSMFQSLIANHDNVFVIDHSEGFKTLFDMRYEVTLVNGNSVMEEV